MSAVAKPRKLTVAEYFALEEKAERKSEFYDGEMFLMAGASREHNTVSRNLTIELGIRLRGGPCQVFVADQRVKIGPTGLYTYPDLLIVCGPPEYAAENRDTLTNPRVVIEILSDSTEKYDRTTKFRHYKQLASVQEYVLVSQDEPLIERFTRLPDGTWAQAEFVGLNASMQLVTAPVGVPLAEIYLGVEFPTPPRSAGPGADFRGQAAADEKPDPAKS
jgi:Uma2 family endonuclease